MFGVLESKSNHDGVRVFLLHSLRPAAWTGSTVDFLTLGWYARRILSNRPSWFCLLLQLWIIIPMGMKPYKSADEHSIFPQLWSLQVQCRRVGFSPAAQLTLGSRKPETKTGKCRQSHTQPRFRNGFSLFLKQYIRKLVSSARFGEFVRG